jgi:hypothetical protein
VVAAGTPSQTPIKSIFKKMQSVASLNATPTSIRATTNAPSNVATSTSPQHQDKSTSRFSFSKLTKFVSRSALKVMNRKTSTDSLGESLETSSSSDTSILNYEEENNQLNKLSHMREAAAANVATHPRVISPKVSQTTTFTNGVFSSSGLANRQARKNRPVMGITALMLNKHRQQVLSNGQQYGLYGMTTGVMMPNMFLVGLPIVFNPANLIDEKTNENSNYDRLTRGNSNQTSSSQQHPQQSSLKTSVIKTNPNQCQTYRTSVYSNKKSSPLSKHQFSVNDAYDSIREAVF